VLLLPGDGLTDTRVLPSAKNRVGGNRAEGCQSRPMEISLNAVFATYFGSGLRGTDICGILLKSRSTISEPDRDRKLKHIGSFSISADVAHAPSWWQGQFTQPRPLQVGQLIFPDPPHALQFHHPSPLFPMHFTHRVFPMPWHLRHVGFKITA